MKPEARKVPGQKNPGEPGPGLMNQYPESNPGEPSSGGLFKVTAAHLSDGVARGLVNPGTGATEIFEGKKLHGWRFSTKIHAPWGCESGIYYITNGPEIVTLIG